MKLPFGKIDMEIVETKTEKWIKSLKYERGNSSALGRGI